MCITQESDYAVRIVFCLAKEGRRCDAGYISENMSITIRFALKILGNLVQKGIVRSYKGNHGGYELAREPKDISIKDVIDAVEGEYHLTRCLGEEGVCNRGMSGVCQFQHLFNEVTQEVNRKFSAATFDKFLENGAE